MRRAFCLFDTDHSRGIDRGEFAAMMCKLNMSGQAEQLDRMFATADTNGDGSITFDEVYPRCVSNSSTRPMMAPPDLSCVRALTCGTSLRPSSRKSRRGRRERRRKRARGKSDLQRRHRRRRPCHARSILRGPRSRASTATCGARLCGYKPRRRRRSENECARWHERQRCGPT